ncbi:MAG TPA: hypothetical protein VHD56_10065 [Tepidisphaeraceae bacterium]|nr:hypothetical protein [Tepidisphaeraceae bacterium]
MALHWAWKQQIDFGREFAFTYGPWGFVLQGFEPSTFKYQVAAWTLFAGVFYAVNAKLARRLDSARVVGFIWLLLMICLLGTNVPNMQDARIFIMAWGLIILHFYLNDEGPTLLKASIIVAIALASLGKFSNALAGITVVGVVGMDELIHRRIPWTIVIYLAAAFLFWIAAGQHLTSLLPYIAHAMEISRGYGQGEGLFSPTEYRDVAIYFAVAIFFLIVVATAQFSSRPRGVALARAGLVFISLAIALLLNFKIGFARHDGHEMVGTTCVAALALMYSAAIWPQAVGYFVRAQLIALVLSCIGLAWSSQQRWDERDLPSHLLDNFIRLGFRAPVAASWLTGQSKLEEGYASYLEDARAFRDIPVTSGTVDVYSYAQRSIFANGLHYRPRPVMQSYLAYTSKLADLNAEFLRSPRAPDSILFEVQPIEDHYPSMEDAASWPEILTRYDLKDATYSLLLFERAKSARNYSFSEIRQSEEVMNRWITVPDAHELIWTKIVLKPRSIGFAELFYKPSPVYMQIRTVDGRTEQFRIIPEVASGGFLLSPCVKDQMSFAFLGSSRGQEFLRDSTVASFKIVGDAVVPSSYEDEFRLVFSRLTLPLRDLSDIPGVSEYLKFREITRRMSVVEGGPVLFQAIEEVPAALLVPNRTLIRINIPPLSKTLHLRFGVMWRGIVPPAGAGPVLFEVRADPGGPPLWKRLLEPGSNKQDENACEVEITLPSPTPNMLLLESTPQRADAISTPYWGGMEFR